MVLPAEQPSIMLNGTPNLAREYEAFVQGIELFSTVNVLVNHEIEPEDGNGVADDTDNGDDADADADSTGDQTARTNAVSKLMNEHKLDTCTIQVYPPLNPDHEYFRLPINYMEHLGVHFLETKDGIVVHGKIIVDPFE